MDVAALIEQALEASGTAVAVVTQPERGEAAVLHRANLPFARLVASTPGALEGTALGGLHERVADPASWSTLLDCLRSLEAAKLDVAFRAGAAATWLQLQVTFGAGGVAEARHAVLIGRDVTGLRLAAEREDESRRLLAAIFSRISAPVVIVRANGEITMGNPAMHNLVRYSPGELKGTKVQDLTAPGYAEAAQAARVKQLQDGEPYEMRIETLAKGGVRIPVRLSSMLLRDEDQRLRVVTLIPETRSQPPARDRGELRALSLAAFQKAFGSDWERIATRAMMLAETIIRRRLCADDVVSRSDDHSFIIWFASTSEDRNGDVLAGVVREIRIRFLTEFGEEAAAHVSATIVPGEARREGAPQPSADAALQVRRWRF